MAIIVRAADLKTDKSTIIEALQKNMGPQCDEGRFTWLYEANPHGFASTWIAEDEKSGALVGIASAFPREMQIEGRVEKCTILGDFAVSSEYRSLGPAIQLQRASLAGIPGLAPFCFDFPSFRMLPIHKRLRAHSVGSIVRLAKPLRVNRQLNRWIKAPSVANRLSALGNRALSFRDGLSTKPQIAEIQERKGACGEEFSHLALEQGGHHGICVHRSASYLSWRYFAHPFCKYEMLAARVQGVLQAYAVFTQTDEDALLVDSFGPMDFVAVSSLVREIGAEARHRGLMTLSVSLLESHPWIAGFQELGFVRREPLPVVAYPSPLFSQTEVWKQNRWFLMHGDRES